MTNETRTYIGETGGPNQAFDGLAGLCIGCSYELQVERRADETVAHMLDHQAHVSPGAGPLVVTG